MRRQIIRMLGLPFALTLGLTLVACDNDSAGPEQGTSVEDVEEAEPDEPGEGADLIGETVTISGEVDEILDPQGFIMGGDALFEDGVLVLSGPTSFEDLGLTLDQSLVDDDTIVEVTGTVEELVVVDFEEEFGLDLDDTVYEEWDGQAVIVAEQVATLAGQDITIAGQVTDLLSTVAFRLAGSGWTVVVLDAEQATVDTGDFVQVNGTVRQFDTVELEEDFGIDLDDEVYSPYVGDLVLVADRVTPAEVVETQ